jgi:hypothetical protein
MNFHVPIPIAAVVEPFVPKIATRDDFERFELCEELAGKLFADATKVQVAAYHETMNHIRPWRDTLRGERAAEAAKRRWDETTAGALNIYRMALRDCFLTGEISQETYAAYDDLMVAA